MIASVPFSRVSFLSVPFFAFFSNYASISDVIANATELNNYNKVTPSCDQTISICRQTVVKQLLSCHLSRLSPTL